jgi:8-oxo-dGTP pyrophosphatase MutT (NUDIX family)
MNGRLDEPGAIENQDARIQYAALPFRERGRLEILLITSRETKRWVIPKGWPMKRRTPPETAAREALEEAGVEGQVADAPIGSYRYFKRRVDGGFWLCEVEVFPLEVKREGKTWPEHEERTRWWCSVDEAVSAVEEPELKALIQAFGTRPPAR